MLHELVNKIFKKQVEQERRNAALETVTFLGSIEDISGAELDRIAKLGRVK